MEIETRLKSAFIEIKVDELETTIYKSDQKELHELLVNLSGVIDDLLSYTGESITDYFNIR
jgi:hypothetical protein